MIEIVLFPKVSHKFDGIVYIEILYQCDILGIFMSV